MNFATAKSNGVVIGRVAVLVGCLLAGSVGAAQAATSTDEVPSVVVRYGDLDLSTTEGARVLYQRISVAARQVCPAPVTRVLALAFKDRACREAAIERAVNTVNNPRLAAMRSEHVKRG
jgi:UrcA family protein